MSKQSATTKKQAAAAAAAEQLDEPDLEHITPDLRALAVPISSIVKDPGNLRLHGEKSIEGIRGSLAAFTQRKPVVVNRRTGVVEAGNGTIDALRANGKTHVAAVFVDDDPVTATAFAIADNRTAELSTWDNAALANTLKAIDFDVPGVDADWLATLEPVAVEPPPVEEDAQDPEAAAEIPTDPISKQGEVYNLGPHRLLCGDCSDASAWAALLGSERVNVCFTSPPYASQRKYDESSGFKPIKPDDYVAWWDPIQANVARHLADDGSFFVNIKEHCEDGQRVLYVKDLAIAHVRQWGWKFVDEFCWRRSGVPGTWPNRFKNSWEPVFHFSKASAIRFRTENVLKDSANAFSYSPNETKPSPNGTPFFSAHPREEGKALPSNLIDVAAGAGQEHGHSASFPVGLPEFFVKAFTDSGDLVLDPFLGSGTTLIAAAMHGRRCFGMEISPAYCDMIRRRWGAWARKAGVEAGEHAL